jgi:hypothetical protein
MGPAETVHRLVEAAKKTSGRRYSGWNAFPTAGPLRTISGAALHLKAGSDMAKAVTIEANNVRCGIFTLLGARWPRPSAMPPSREFWHIDPADGQLWPRCDDYCFDIDFRHGVGTGEIKRIWEINRLQFLLPLAAEAHLNNDSTARELVAGITFSWMDGNVPFRGPNWNSPIELALRLISVAVSLSLTGTDHLDEAGRDKILRFFAAHAFWIARYPSLYSSANNHRVAELAGLVVATTMAPGISNAQRLREQSWLALLAEIEQQILPDGTGAEQAPNYTAFMVEIALVAALFAHEANLALSTGAIERLALWAEHSRWLMSEDGSLPAIGDCDEGRVLALTQTAEPRYVASVVGAVAGVLGRPNLAPPARDDHLRDALFGSPDRPVPLQPGVRSFKDGGLSIVRSSGPPAFTLVFDHGPLGYLSIAAHGHADALAIWLHVRGRPVLVDAGTYLYFGDRRWRDRFRSTSVHNTLVVADTDSSRPAGPFNWATKAKARLISATSEPFPRFVAEHDGYVERFGCRHRRTVEVPQVSSIVIVDELIGGECREPVSVNFLVEPSLRAAVETPTAVRIEENGTPVLRMESLGPLAARIVRGDEAGGLGWISKTFGSRVPTDQIQFGGILGDSRSILRMTII